ncbi:MAG: DUF1062 domain-containing protein [Roseibium sp.]|nr:DUF1062 domain-containing protein [Roseibium sp.]
MDAWLIYRCSECDKRWNRPVFQRQPLSSLRARYLAQLQENDPHLARQIERRSLSGILLQDRGEAAAFTIDKRMDDISSGTVDTVRLRVMNPSASDVRLDRVLATGLGVSRKEVTALFDCGQMSLNDRSGKWLKRALPVSLEVLANIRGDDAESVSKLLTLGDFS